MKTPKPSKSDAQRAEEERTQAENFRTIQEQLAARTSARQRYIQPRMSLFTGAVTRSGGL